MKKYLLIYNLIPNKQKFSFFILLILIFFSILAELLGITLIIPTIASLVDETNSTLNFFDNKILFFKVLKNLDIKILLIIFLSIFLFKSVFLIYVNYYTQSFIANVQKDITSRIFRCNLKKDYAFFLNENSSNKHRNILDVTNNYIYQCLIPLVQLISEISFIFFISFFLLLIDPVSLFIVFTFTLFLLILYFRVINKKLYQWGESKQIFSSQRIKILRESVNGILFIKLNNLSSFFSKHFDSINNTLISLQKKLLFLTNIIKVFLELFTIIVLIFLIFFLIQRGFTKLEILSLLSVYVICAFKLLPSANRVTVNIQTIKFGVSNLSILQIELQQQNNEEYLISNQIQFEKKLNLKNISFGYDHNLNIFENLNLEIKKNDFAGILGDSGSGKSTLVNILCGLLIPSKGQILIDGVDVTKNYFLMQKTIGYVPQTNFLIDDTIKANIALGIEKYSLKRINEIISEYGFAKFIQELPNGVDTVVGEDGNKLSVGQKQRLSILRALYNNPQILIFDESSSALDQKNEEIFINSIMEFKSKKTVIFITHKLELLKSFNKIYKIEDKQILQLK